MTCEFTGPAGRIEALLDVPPGPPKAVVVFAHPHPLLGGGGSMHTKAVYQGAKGLVRIGCAVLRFNFRGVGRSEGEFDNGVGERDDFRAAIDYVANRFPGTPIWAAGFSFGSWIALEVGAVDPRVTLLIGIAPPWNINRETNAEPKQYVWKEIFETTKPKFFVQGEGDEICAVQDMWGAYGRMHEPKELVVIDAASHLFEGKTAEVGEALEDLLGDVD